MQSKQAEKRRTLDRKQARSLKRCTRDAFLTGLVAEERAKPRAQRRAEAKLREVLSDALEGVS
jgi:hypothetical protein